jgi:hypothetical protein
MKLLTISTDAVLDLEVLADLRRRYGDVALGG